jgi:pimeloyl-ACP methyl ester carboxylesterase
VYAPTIPGFGRSEKPALAYSQALWLDFLRDFVIEVVRRPVVVVGNSIGGYISASLAAACPGIVKGVVSFALLSVCISLHTASRHARKALQHLACTAAMSARPIARGGDPAALL